jgi:protease I
MFGLWRDTKRNKDIGERMVLFIIAPKDYRDEECFYTKEEIETRGITAVIASTSPGEKSGMLGGTIKAEIALSEAKPEDYDAVVFVGGTGSSVYFNDPLAHKIAKEAYSAGKIVGAICIAPVILANAGILKGKKATVYPADAGISALKKAGASYTGKLVEADGRIITGSGPEAAREFGKRIAAAIS